MAAFWNPTRVGGDLRGRPDRVRARAGTDGGRGAVRGGGALEVALKLVEGLGNIGIKNLLHGFGTPEHVFSAPLHLLETVPGIGSKTARHIKDFKQWAAGR